MPNKIRIAMIVPSLSFKGPVIVAFNIIKFNSDDNLEFDIISLRNNSEKNKKKFINNNINIIELGMGKVPTFKFINVLTKFIHQSDYDIIHVHSYWPTILISLIKTKKVKIVTIHNNPNYDFVYEYGKLIGKTMARTFLKALARFDNCVAISQYIKEIISIPNCIVIYNGVEDYTDNLILDRKTNEFLHCIQDNNCITLASISALNKVKNVGRIIKIVERCLCNGINAKCIIVGDGYQRDKLEHYTNKKKLNNNILFLGSKSHEEIYSILSNVKALILTSESEGFGLVVAEAFMRSKIAIVNDIPVMHEIVSHGENGFIINSDEEFIEMIKKLSVLDTKEMNLKARKKYEDCFSVDKMCSNYAKVYKNSKLC
jgi:glycosyltransferase involved in cell wall biosynthesis